MTNEEALEELNRNIEIAERVQRTEQEVIDYYYVLKEALEKQISKETIWRAPTHNLRLRKTFTCAVCGYAIIPRANYCHRCGQRLE